MKNKVVSIRPTPGPSVRPDPDAVLKWMASPTLAVVIVGFIALNSVLTGEWVARTLGVSYLWAIIVMLPMIVVQMVVLARVAKFMHVRYQRAHAIHPEKPLDLAA